MAIHEETKRIAIMNDDKSLFCFDLESGSVISERKILKRGNQVSFSIDGDYVLVGDKFGDVYRFPVADEKCEPALMYGCVSMMMDIIPSFDGKYVISCDRDEKIRVVCYPNTFEIHSFCLGHLELVSCLAIHPKQHDILYSAGGDPFFITWDWKSGQELSRMDFSSLVDAPTVVSSITLSQKNDLMAIVLEGLSYLLVYSIQDAQNPSFLQKVQLDEVILFAHYDVNGNLLISTERGVAMIKSSADQIAQYSYQDALVQQINQVEIIPEHPVKDFTPLSKLKKDAIKIKRDGEPKKRKSEILETEVEAKKVVVGN